MPQSVFNWYFLSVSKYFSHCSTSGPRTGFLSPEPDFQKKFKMPQNMFSWCFLSVSRYFSIVRICAENHIFEPRTGFSRISHKASKHVLLVFSGCFNVFFSIVRHLSREPNFWAENQIFKKFLKSLKTCLVGVFWVFHGFFLALFDIWAENRIFEPRTRFSRNSWKASKHV